jgi:hypothetical protein
VAADPDFQLVAGRWSSLPAAIRAAIVALVNAST